MQQTDRNGAKGLEQGRKCKDASRRAQTSANAQGDSLCRKSEKDAPQTRYNAEKVLSERF
jgi:hypothetical protein